MNEITIDDYRSVKETVLSWKGRKVIVAGDMILDEYLYGTTDRVSREAPVVIVRYDGSSWCPGGAANAATNIASLGGKAFVTLTGNVAAVRSAVDAGARVISAKGLLTNKVVIAHPRPELLNEII